MRHSGRKAEVKSLSLMQDQAKEFVRRAPLLGLGATSALQSHKEKKYIRPGESREGKKDLVVYDDKGNIKHTRTASDKLVERKVKGPAVGKQMRIVRGRHAGIRCKVCTIDPQVGFALGSLTNGKCKRL